MPVITLPVRDTRTPTVEAAATPPDKAIMFKSEFAVTSREVPLVTFEPSILDVTVSTTTLAPARTPTATAPEPATLIARDLMVDISSVEISTRPPAVTVEPPSISASTLFVITLPKPVALTATAPEPATPTVIEIIPAWLSLSSRISPMLDVTWEFEMAVVTLLAMTFPVKAALTATLPDAATLIFKASMFASSSMGLPSRAAFKSS